MATSVDEFDAYLMESVPDDMCIVEATVNTGLEYPARDEVIEKIKNASVTISRGRLFIKLSKCDATEVLKLHSIDNCLVLMNYYKDLALPQDELEAMRFLRELVPEINWKAGLDIWKIIFPFPYEIATIPSVIPDNLGEPEIIFRDKMPKKSKNQNSKRVCSDKDGFGEKAAAESHNEDIRDGGNLNDKCRENANPNRGGDPSGSGDSLHQSADEDGAGVEIPSNRSPRDCCSERESINEGRKNIDDAEYNETTTNNSHEKPAKMFDPKMPTFRVTCHRTGDKHKFNSMCAAANFGGAIFSYFKWNVDMKNFDIEVILDIDDCDIYVGLSLTKESLHRRNLSLFGPTTLRPTIAYNLLRLCDIQQGDVVCDPMCGGGSIPIEAAVDWFDAHHIAGEIHHKAIERTHSNITNLNEKRLSKSKRPVNIDVIRWDTTRLPLNDNAIDVLVTDLPFGKRIGNRGDNWKLYPRILIELARVCKVSTGRACFLTQDRKCFSKTLNEVRRYWRKQTTLWTNIGGLTAGVYVLYRTATCV